MTECAVLEEKGAACSGLAGQLRTSAISCGGGKQGRDLRSAGKEMQKTRQLFILQSREAGHAAFAGVNQQSDLLICHLSLDANKRRKRRQDAFAILAVANRAMLCV
jgi:hypothetical protein